MPLAVIVDMDFAENFTTPHQQAATIPPDEFSR